MIRSTGTTPTMSKSLYGKAINCEADSQYNKGITYCEEALKLPEQREMEPSLYNTYGNLLGDIGQKDKALSIFDAAIAKYPAFSPLYFNKGLNLYIQERYAEAESVFKQTLMINPYQYSAHFYLGLSAIQQGKNGPGTF